MSATKISIDRQSCGKTNIYSIPRGEGILDSNAIGESFGGFIEPTLNQRHHVFKLRAILFSNFASQAYHVIKKYRAQFYKTFFANMDWQDFGTACVRHES